MVELKTLISAWLAPLFVLVVVAAFVLAALAIFLGPAQ